MSETVFLDLKWHFIVTAEFLLHLISGYLLGLRKSSSKDSELNTQTPTTRRLPHAVPGGVIAIKNGDVRKIEVIAD